MSKMRPDTPLDYALFQLSPRRSRCELIVSSDGSTEKIASGLLKPFVAHLKIAEEQVSSAAQIVKLEVGQNKNSEAWFTKGTLERFVRFVSTPEILELVGTFDAEMSQLEAARRIYSQGAGDQLSATGGIGSGMTASEDATKKELLRAIDVRLVAIQQDLSAACTRAAAAGFNFDSVSELQMFAHRFGAHRLNEACSKLISLCERRPDLMNQWKSTSAERVIRSSYGSDMSLDDDTPPNQPPQQERHTTLQQPPQSLPINHTFSRESSVEREVIDKKEESRSTSDQTTESLVQASQPTRRLSVQDRINMFENKQKETSVGKTAVVKSTDLRRMPSDVSSSGSTLLRRWSGVSDMSIDLSFEKKETESPLCTPPASAPVSENKIAEEETALNSSEKVVMSHSSKSEIMSNHSLSKVDDIGELKGGNFYKVESTSNSGSVAISGLRDQISGMILPRSISAIDECQEDPRQKFKSVPADQSECVMGFGNEGKTKSFQDSTISNIDGSGTTLLEEAAGVKDTASFARSRAPGSIIGGHAKPFNQIEDTELKVQPIKQLRLKATQKTLGETVNNEAGAGSRIREAFTARYKGTGGDSVSAHSEFKTFREFEGVEKKEARLTERMNIGPVQNAEDSYPQKLKFSKKPQLQRDDSSISGTKEAPFSEESFKTPPPEQGERIRQSKGNQDLNDELKMKANELEKLFAEHKLRVPGDQSTSASRSRQSNTQHEAVASFYRPKPEANIGLQMSDNNQLMEPVGNSKSSPNFVATPLISTLANQNHGDAQNKKFSELNVSDSSRGKLYERYTQKRDAKLREDWSINRAEKEARLKSMQDSFEWSKSELKIKFKGSEHGQDSVISARRRAERLRSFTSKSITKRMQHLDFGNFENEDTLNFLERNDLREDVAPDDTNFVEDYSGGMSTKKLVPNHKSLTASLARNPAASVSRSATKTPSMNSRRRKMQSENPLVQSVPNYSDLRKENTKPSSGPSKLTRPQVRTYDRNKNTSEESVVKEDKSHGYNEEVLKNFATKSFLKKGNRTGFSARASIGNYKDSVVSSQINNVFENNDLDSETDDPENTIKGGEIFETLNTKGGQTFDNEEQRTRREMETYFDSGSENGDNTVIFSQLDQALGSQLPSVPSSFLPIASLQDWQGESPTSWNLPIQNSLSYPQDMSDVDASVDSPVGSPASWNSQSLSQVEADAARMRKKWETAQKPMLVTNSSNNPSRKDMTRGFKRFLKFGRRNRGSESVVDWISATTSEGDDDTEDGRDPSYRSSEDPRKSRMGFSQAQPSDESFNENEFFHEQVQSSQNSIPAPSSNFKLAEEHSSGTFIKAPKSSFFSLSSFRSKGNETKLR